MRVTSEADKRAHLPGDMESRGSGYRLVLSPANPSSFRSSGRQCAWEGVVGFPVD